MVEVRLCWRGVTVRGVYGGEGKPHMLVLSMVALGPFHAKAVWLCMFWPSGMVGSFCFRCLDLCFLSVRGGGVNGPRLFGSVFSCRQRRLSNWALDVWLCVFWATGNVVRAKQEPDALTSSITYQCGNCRRCDRVEN